MGAEKGAEMKILIAIPCLDHIDTEFAASLCALNKPGTVDVKFQQSSLVYDSRNRLCEYAIDNEYDYVLWLDSDMTFNEDMLIDMLKDLKDSKGQYDAVAGIFFARRPNFEPCVWTKIRLSNVPEEAIIERVEDVPSEPFEIDACGMAAVLMHIDVIKAVSKYGSGMPFSPMIGFGEDVSFCIRARKLGYNFLCDPRIKVGHMARTTVCEDTYLAWKQRLENNNGDNNNS